MKTVIILRKKVYVSRHYRILTLSLVSHPIMKQHIYHPITIIVKLAINRDIGSAPSSHEDVFPAAVAMVTARFALHMKTRLSSNNVGKELWATGDGGTSQMSDMTLPRTVGRRIWMMTATKLMELSVRTMLK